MVRPRFPLALLCAVATVSMLGSGACGAPTVDPLQTASTIAKSDMAAAIFLRATKDGFTSDDQGFASVGLRHARRGNFADLATALPKLGSGTITLGPGNVSSLRMQLTPVGAKHAVGEEHEGRVLYPAVFDDVDEIVGGSASTTEIFYLLKSAEATHAFSWKVQLPKGIATVETRADGVWFLDSANAFVLRVPSAYAIDAKGSKIAANLSWNREESTLSASLDKSASYTYPILLDPAFETKVWSELKNPRDIEYPAMTYDTARRNAVLTSVGQTWTWDGAGWNARIVERGSVAPSNRIGARIAYDEKRGNAVYFGGTYANRAFADTWLWNGTEWATARPSLSPSARSFYSMAYDPTREEVVVFGGQASGPPFQDTWVWNGTTWAERTPATKPPARYLATMAYDSARKKIMLFGGAGTAGLLDDTWEWNGQDWRKITTSAFPEARASASLAFDEARQQLVLFGGATGAGRSNETWTFDGTTWKRATPPIAPAPVTDAALTYDRGAKRILLFGGQLEDRNNNGTWSWDGTTWRLLQNGDRPKLSEENTPLYANEAKQELQIFNANGYDVDDTTNEVAWAFSGQTWSRRTYRSSPVTRRGAAMAWDAFRRETVLFGGAGDERLLADTWVYTDGGWGSPAPGISPPARARHRLAYHPARQEVLLFGGSNDDGFLNDTWTWNGATWTQRKPGPSPKARIHFGMSVHPGSGKIVLYGGRDEQDNWLEDTWTWDGSTWFEESSNKIPDPKMGVVLMSSHVDCFLVQKSGQRWTWDGRNWFERARLPTLEWDPYKWNPEGEWDPVRRRYVIVGPDRTFFGDLDSPFEEVPNGRTIYGGIVAWNGRTMLRVSNEDGDVFRNDRAYHIPETKDEWQPSEDGSLYPQETFAAAYDSTRKVGVLVGRDRSDVPRTWTWDGVAMRNRTSNMPMGRRRGAAFSFDANRQRGVLFGGNADSAETSDTFLWDGSDWTQASPPAAPPARNFSASAFDPVRGNIVIFGGESGAGYLGDTWVWDGNTWTEKRPATVPTPRSRTSLTWNPLTGTVLLFGGLNESGALTDTWSWNGTDWSQVVTKVSPVQRANHALVHDTSTKRSFVYGGSTFNTSSSQNVWAFYARGGACGTAADCGTGSCVDGVCCEVPSCGSCQTCAGTDPGLCTTIVNAEDPDTCAAANQVSCNEKGVCGPSLGGACTEGSQCGSGICAGGVCCDATCDNPCESCRAVEKASGRDDGRCGPAKAGTNPDSKCAGKATCSAAGVCSESVGTSCRDARYFETLAGSSKDCAPYKCVGQCLTRCSSANDCVFPATCGLDGTCAAPRTATVDAGGCSIHATSANPLGAAIPFGLSLLFLLRARSRTRGRRRHDHI